MPLLSVIVPVHDAAADLQECIDSVLGQDLADLELLLVDDCSTDGSAQVIAGATDPRVIRLATAVSRGPGPARNLALGLATGQIVMFLDADDTLAPGAVRAVAARHAELTGPDGAGPDIVLHDYAHVGPDGGVRPNPESGTIRAAARRGRFALAESPELLRLFNAAWTRSYRRDFLVRIEASFPEGLYEDIPWAMGTLVRAESLAALAQVVVHYHHRSSGSILRSAHRAHFDVFDQWDRAFADLAADPARAPYAGELVEFMVAQFDTMLRNPVRLPADMRPEFLRGASECAQRHVPDDWRPMRVGQGGQRMRQRALVRGWATVYRLLAAGKPAVDSVKELVGRRHENRLPARSAGGRGQP